MAIEFQCERCGKKLRTPDTAAGKQVKCPACGEITRLAAGAGDDFARSHSQPPGMSWDAGDLAANPYRAPEIQPKPAGPTEIAYDGGRSDVDISDVWSRAWAILKDNLPIGIGAFLVPLIIQFGVAIPLAMLIDAIHPAAGPQDRSVNHVLLQLATNLLSAYLAVGQQALMLNLARGREAKMIDLFPPALLALKVIVGWLLMVLAVVLTAITIVGPFIVVLMYWPFPYIIIERGAGIGESFGRAKEMTYGNRLNVLVLGIVTWIVTAAATVLTCCLGSIIAAPFSMLVFAVAYVVICGQPMAAGPMSTGPTADPLH